MECGLAGDAAAELDADALDFGGVAGLEAHPELVGAVVDEEDGEDAVVDDGADEVGDAMHEGVEVKGGVEGVGKAEEEVELEGLDADVGVGGVGMEEGAAGRSVVPFVRCGVRMERGRWTMVARAALGAMILLRCVERAGGQAGRPVPERSMR